MADLTAKERMQIDRVKMLEQDAEQRAHNFKEVNLGLSEERALEEAQRCISCKNKQCMEGCQVEVHITEFIEAVAEHDFTRAAE